MASSSPVSGIIVAFCNAPDAETAHAIATQLIQSHFAACVNILPASTSVYHWQGTICNDTEITLIIKTTAARLPDIKKSLREMHPDETPELIALPVVDGFADYLQWVEKSVEESDK